MLLLRVFCLLGISAAMLSKCLDPNTDNCVDLTMKRLQLQNEKATLLERKAQITSTLSKNKEELAACKSTLCKNKETLAIIREQKVARVRTLGQLARSYIEMNVLNSKLDLVSAKRRVGYYLGVGIDGLLKSIIEKAPELIAEIVSVKYVLHLITSFYLCPKENIPAYYWNLKHLVNLLKEAAGRGGADERTRECWLMLESCVTAYLEKFSMLFASEPAFVEQSEWEKIFPLVDILGIIDAYIALPEASQKNVNAIFANPKFGLLKTDPIMHLIKKDFKITCELITKEMDTQFPVQKPEDLINETSNEASEKKEEYEEVKTLKAKKSVSIEKEEKRNAKAEARSLKEKEKHKQRVEKLKDSISISEADDQDVTFFYISKIPEANFIFHKNQSNQVCRRTFESSERFEHSLFPGLTASGTTLNFLCSLMVSGNPDYEGFCDAHKDLGGIFVAKKNGNKLFLFNEPISYHKTLHAPHQSSRFDHILYRRFYRNCGLHPYFFKIDREEK